MEHGAWSMGAQGEKPPSRRRQPIPAPTPTQPPGWGGSVAVHAAFSPRGALPSPLPSPCQVTSIDTMKDSKDTCASPMTAEAIAQEINLTATLEVTHIAISTSYDYPEYLTTWVNAIRAAGKQVWFRPHWNRWEGNNGQPAEMTPASYLTQTQAFIAAHPTLFARGDIFDPCPEPENSPYWATTYGATWSWSPHAPNPATDAFNQFLLDGSSQAQSALTTAGVTGVVTGMRSVSPWWTYHPDALYASTLQTLGYVVQDGYPEGLNTDPTACTAARLHEITLAHNAHPTLPLVIGEMGYANSMQVSDEVQNAVLAAEFAMLATLEYLAGVNYWVGAGGSGYGGYTNIFTGTRGNWRLRPAATTVSHGFRVLRHRST
jgi:hypothetical protein